LASCANQVLPAASDDCTNNLDDDCSGTYCTQPKWVGNFGGQAFPDGIAVDASGNSYVVGYFPANLPLGATTLISAGGPDAFLVKLDSAGNPQWSKQFGGLLNQFATDVAVDSAGNVVVVGEFQSAVSFDGVNTVTAQGTDAFVVKLSPAGAVLWTKVFNEGAGNGNGSQGAKGVAIDKNNDVVVTGYFSNGMSPGIVFGGTTLAGKGGTEFFVAKLKGADGTPIWANAGGDVGTHYGNRVRADSAGNIVVAGEFTNTMTLGATLLTASAGGNDVFVARLTTLGAYSWAHNWGSGKSDSLTGLAVDSAGRITFTGNLQGTMNFGGGPLTNPANGGVGINSYVAQVDSAGFYKWAKQLGSSSAANPFVNVATSLAVDAADNIYVTGACGGQFDLGANFTCGSVVFGGGTPFLLRLTSSGSPGFDRTYGTHGGPLFGSAVLANSLWVVGRNDGGIDFGSGLQPSVSTHDLIVSTIVTN
jgi:hypothetical protein